MSKGLIKNSGFIISVVLYLLFALFVPKAFFIMHPAEMSLSVYGGSKLFPFPCFVIASDKGIPILPNTYILRTPLAGAASAFEAGKTGDVRPVFYSLNDVAADISALSPGRTAILLPAGFDAGKIGNVVVKRYSRSYSAYERDAVVKSFDESGIEAVIVPFPPDGEVLFDDMSRIYYLPLSFAPYYSGTNILYYAPDLEALKKDMLKGDELRIETRISKDSL